MRRGGENFCQKSTNNTFQRFSSLNEQVVVCLSGEKILLEHQVLNFEASLNNLVIVNHERRKPFKFSPKFQNLKQHLTKRSRKTFSLFENAKLIELNCAEFSLYNHI